ncbi:hypothetical protein ACQKOD_06100 [Bacillus mycoides]|uniref:hypothetical protein n=1 Tax=Bacillus mycoides TaxID=1405 RepID=UPI003D078C8D
MRQYGSVVYGSVSTDRDWDDLRHHLLYKIDTGINLSSHRTRARQHDLPATFISVITPEVYAIVIPAMIGICENKGVDVSYIMKYA